ncbi:dihydroneopterin aldolase [Sporosarcina gallistercoris]|uniref:7,8-dihydroneopterin aldolase n=1 Tax=Sporosarcina gallistercoris TaxID=2762245 RepID=A0ABR8PMT7_9BACL|nr:dihydroneopterin aldolase [Sporosarcina gallistercoris]MBD7909498.1 dihydroneopterin aldolase [Sporosarcina gallistercoris]
MDFIHLNEMQFYGYHGALSEETVLGQRFTVTVSMAVDLAEAGTNDDLSKTVNYAEAYSVVQSIVEGEPVKLIEAVAERIAVKLLADYKGRVSGVRVLVVKPDPPIPGHYSSVSVEIERGRLS